MPIKQLPKKGRKLWLFKENLMKRIALALLIAFSAAAVTAQVKEEDHSAHHPEGGTATLPATAPAPSAVRPAPARPAAGDRFAQQMNRMRDMHTRLQAAKTPAERQALMDEHMKLMQSGMAMMKEMGGRPGMSGRGAQSGGMGSGQGSAPANDASMGSGEMMGMHGAMERRMAMMEEMMQMMLDREAAMPRR
jgi:hypothetical protein